MKFVDCWGMLRQQESTISKRKLAKVSVMFFCSAIKLSVLDSVRFYQLFEIAQEANKLLTTDNLNRYPDQT